MVGPEKNVRAQKFEIRIVRLLENIGFSHVDGGKNLIIGSHQIDACGGHQETLFVVECTTQKGSLRSKMNELRGKTNAIDNGIKELQNYRKYSKLIYCIATNRDEVSENNSDFSQDEKPEISIWDDKLIRYYEELASSLGKLAKFTLLADCGVSPVPKDELKVPAFRVEIEGKVLFSFTVDPKKLLRFCYVARREVGKEDYYQRILRKNRLRGIAHFINEGGFFANNIIIGIDKKSRFERIAEMEDRLMNWPRYMQFGILTLPHNYNTCWVIDGQHRLFAFCKAKEERPVCVTAFDNLPKEKQAAFFIDINREAKPVEPDLLWDLLGDLRPESQEGIISRTVKEMNKGEPLDRLIYIPKYGSKRKGQLRFSGLCISLQKRKLTLERTEEGKGNNPLYRTDTEELVKNASKHLKRYFYIVKEVMKENWDLGNKGFVVSNGGISVIIILYERILSIEDRIPDEGKIRSYMKTLKEIIVHRDLKRLRDLCNSEGGKSDLARELMAQMLNKHPEFKKHVEMPDLHKSLTRFEMDFREFVSKIMLRVSADWMKQRVNENIYRRAKKNAERDKSHDIVKFLTLGDCREIIERRDNSPYFEEALVKPEGGFDDMDEFRVALKKILKARRNLEHRNEEKTISSPRFQDYFKQMNDLIKAA